MSRDGAPGGRLRVGFGWDIHRLVAGRPLVLAGVRVPAEKGLLGHSDGDVVLHAVIDAMLGGAGLGDIGEMFPDNDPALRDADSRRLLASALERVEAAGFRPVQVDSVVVLEQPKLAGHKPGMRQSLAGLLGLDVSLVNIKGKTAEGLGEVGRGEAAACYAVVLLVPVEAGASESG